MGRLRLAFYWAASCGGCEISVLEIGEHIFDVADVADIVFWPAVLDFKYADVERMPDRSIDVCFFNGGIRLSENERIANLLRQKSKVLVAFGSCACEGCIPGLANLKRREDIFQRVYKETPSTNNPEGRLPVIKVQVDEGELELPQFYEQLKTLAQVVDVDYFIPGCPPVGEQVWAGIQAIAGGKLPPKGSFIGCSERALCDECPRKREKKKIKKIYRNYELLPDREKCLLDQGVLCMGPATRGGCSALCVKANMPCIGCYGPPPGIVDQGAKMISALSSVIDAKDEEEAEKILADIFDPAGTFYFFGLANSQLRGAKR